MPHARLTRRAAEKDILVPMLDNRVCGVDYGSVHIEKYSGRIVHFGRTREGWGFL